MLAVLAAGSALALGGCGGSSATIPLVGTIVEINESDFHISAPDHVKAGKVVLRVRNQGPDQHELIVARGAASSIPLRSDGLTVDEEAIKREEPGSLEPGQPGAVRDLSVDLAPGRYVFFCNMEGHYLGGMRHEIVVSR